MEQFFSRYTAANEPRSFRWESAFWSAEPQMLIWTNKWYT